MPKQEKELIEFEPETMRMAKALLWTLRAVLVVVFVTALLVLTGTAHAAVYVGPDGVGYAGKHHWWTNDGRQADLPSLPGHEPKLVKEEERRSEHETPMQAEGRTQRELDQVIRAARRDRAWSLYRAKCRWWQVKYLKRHGDRKPRSLAGEHGCRLWRDDAQYHDRRRTAWLGGWMSKLTDRSLGA